MIIFWSIVSLLFFSDILYSQSQSLSFHHFDDEMPHVLNDSLYSYCSFLYSKGYMNATRTDLQSKHRGYDTLRLFIESCATSSSIPGCGLPFHAFGDLDGCVADMGSNNSRWYEYREWLKSVLYLSTDSNYYCADAGSIIGSLRSPVGVGDDINAIVAVTDYLLSVNRCPDLKKSFIEDRQYIRDFEARVWRDSVHNPLLTPLDTSAVSIESIGLSILRGPQFGSVRRVAHSGGILGSLRAKRNPFSTETTLNIEVGDIVMLKLELIDILGTVVYSESKFCTDEKAEWEITGNVLPSGTLYARVSTHSGEVRTIKLIKE